MGPIELGEGLTDRMAAVLKAGHDKVKLGQSDFNGEKTKTFPA